MKRIMPSAQKSACTFSFCGNSAQLQWKFEGEITIMTISIPYTGAYGMGEKYNAFNQKGFTSVNCVEEKFCHQQEKTYCAAPFFMTDTGFGCSVETNEKTVFDFGEKITVTMPSNTSIILFGGTPKQILKKYMSLLGPAKLLPKWAFGPWISANHWNTQKKAESQIEKLQHYHFPATVLVLEAWSDEATFYIFNGANYIPVRGDEKLNYSDFDFSKGPWPNPKEMIALLHQKGLHLVLWQIPVYKKLGPEEPFNVQNEKDRTFAIQKKLCVQTKEGQPYQIPEGHWFAGSLIPDFTNPESKRVWFSKRQYLLDIGVDGFKTDGGEFVYQEDLCFYNGSTGKQMENGYAQCYTAAYSDFLERNKKEYVLFSRAGYTGQHTTPTLWAGDQKSENCELRSVLRAGLSAAMTGIIFWGFDIAGFSGPIPSLDLYRRATQMACFCPVMQWHSEPDGGQFYEETKITEKSNERSPWNVAYIHHSPDFIDEMRFWHIMRMNLLPYLYSTAADCVRENCPMMRPLVYDFPKEPVQTIEDEFLLGESLLVAPLLDENAQSRSVYLPRGRWYNLFTGKRQEGGQVAFVNSPKRLPVYIRSGYGLALNLNQAGKFGENVGNDVNSYQVLTFFLAGESGRYHFHDDLGNDLTLAWDASGWKAEGGNVPFKVRFIR
jgi:alpha-D-xyloside xylohydrolase